MAVEKKGREKITLQEIADRVGVSRNTVSKILNDRYTGSSEIKDRVLRMLQETNYRGIGSLSGEEERQVRNILLLSREKVIKSEFFYSLVTEIQQNVEAKGCVLMLHTLQDEDIEQGQIPVAVRNHQADGIVCMEIFSKEYIEELLSYGVPTIFFEFYYDLWAIPGKYDVVMMNNEQPVYELTSRMLERGCRNVGFVGDFMHCRGFYERYQGYCRALTEHGIPLEKKYSLTFEDAKEYHEKDSLWERLKGMEEFPDAFVAANDSIAIILLEVLSEHGIRVPEMIKVAGFDDLKSASETVPPLTTVNSNRNALSKRVIECLLQRMGEPGRLKNVLYVESDVVYRASV